MVSRRAVRPESMATALFFSVGEDPEEQHIMIVGNALGTIDGRRPLPAGHGRT
jgi:hypothetical protein